MPIPALLGPLACLVLGTAALAVPLRFAAQTGLTATGALGRSELRAVFGGVFVGLAAACLAVAAPGAHWAAAAAFAGGAAAKLLSAALERDVFPAALPGLAVDLAAAALFAWGALSL
ncbi:MAG TPA: hypothetical protein VNO26_14155 [Candidatus Limnocylindria bacterium]|nr:hypothetical protein [Candidatus Limnocylindria bacterium]